MSSQLIMRLSQVYQERLSQATTLGVRRTVENILRVRFGDLDVELAAAIDRLVALPEEELAIALVQLSREELLARVKGSDEDSTR